MLNLVGFQTRLRIGEQKRLLRGLPGMSRAVFARFGSVHRNTYVNAPRVLTETLELRARPGLYLAGQMAGVEGYVESAALGLLAGVNAAFATRGEQPPLPDAATAHGALLGHLRAAAPRGFQPMNVNYGLFPPLADTARRIPRAEKNRRLAERALDAVGGFAGAIGVRREAA
jgi:methylenetetrahydrofolate--tRNA-(uracil-5-)-methyltransferase